MPNFGDRASNRRVKWWQEVVQPSSAIARDLGVGDYFTSGNSWSAAGRPISTSWQDALRNNLREAAGALDIAWSSSKLNSRDAAKAFVGKLQEAFDARRAATLSAEEATAAEAAAVAAAADLDARRAEKFANVVYQPGTGPSVVPSALDPELDPLGTDYTVYTNYNGADEGLHWGWYAGGVALLGILGAAVVLKRNAAA